MERLDNEPTIFSHPGWRVAYNTVTWVVLGITLSPGNSIFVGLFMLGFGLLFDYAKFKPVTRPRAIAKNVGGSIATVLIVFNLLASFGAVTVNEKMYLVVVSFPFFKGMAFDVKWYWLITGITVFMTVVDWVTEYIENRNCNETETKPLEIVTSNTGIGG
ncbi:hypothetical protein T3H97_06430 [Paenibacillus sp. LX16]|uniref:hypothetical protein n=1 Tax=Paenibacillus sp. LX16 TaxID=1740264 RepID=UPI002E2E48B4|nr:hypothetical protein [Paenibacillus sp. LX16]